ncbi:MAG: class I SAM-dependent methyltransferase [Anaerolineales bacterium]
MQQTIQIEIREVLNAFETLENIYPRVLPLTMWRAWELAAYRHFELPGPVLDLACGDGSFFRLAWPNVHDVVGIDIDPATVERAQTSGVYQNVYNISANKLPFGNNSFGSIFSNCALEHMDDIKDVISEAYRVLRPNGLFLLSVVTNHFLDWTPLPFLTKALGFPERWTALKEEYERYHHLRNPFPVDAWSKLFEDAEFVIDKNIPILPDAFGHIFLLFDQLWHIPYQDTEISTLMYPMLLNLPNYSEGMHDILCGLYKLSKNDGQGAGVVFALRKK